MTLDNDPVIMDVRFRLNAAIERHGRNLIGGGAVSFDAYRYEVGRIKGLNEALSIISDSIKLYLDDIDK